MRLMHLRQPLAGLLQSLKSLRVNFWLSFKEYKRGTICRTPISSPIGPRRLCSQFFWINRSSVHLYVTVTWNNAALPPGSRCRLVSTNPEVSVTLVPVSVGASGEMYQCTLFPQTHLGELAGIIQAIVTLPEQKLVIVGEVPLRGEVQGNVAAAPAIVAFGAVPTGQAALRQINLLLMRAELPDITSASP